MEFESSIKPSFQLLNIFYRKKIRKGNQFDCDILRPKQQFSKCTPERFETKLFVILDN